MKSIQGQSLATIDKERRIGAALSVSMKIASAKFANKGYRFWHFDANSGSGWNEMVGVPGSPLVFWQIARACLRGLQPAPFFCDIDPVAIGELKKRLDGSGDRSSLLPGDNQEAIEVFAEVIRRSGERSKFVVGSVLIDPNGYFYRDANGFGAPVEAIQWFTREFPRIDLLLNLNVRTYQLQHAQRHAVRSPRELLGALNKTHWLVGRAYVGHARFLLAVGRNMDAGDHRAIGLHRLGSPEGQLILNAAEGSRQDELPDLSRVSAASRFSGSPSGGPASHSGPVSDLRGGGNGSASPAISAVGNVRRPVEFDAALPPLPLFGAWEG